MSGWKISEGKARQLKERFEKLCIFEKDMEERFITSSGPGGQNVNKVATCVFLRHIPSGIQVKCQDERSQARNRYKARVLLLDKIKQSQRLKRQNTIDRIEKNKRRNRKRPQFLKEKVLEHKRKHAEKKSQRRKISLHKTMDY